MNNYTQVYRNQNIFSTYPKRHPLNLDICLHYDNQYRGAEVNVNGGPMVREYMDGLIETYQKQSADYSRVFAVMVSLSFPKDWTEEQRISRDYYSRFMDSLNAQIRHFNDGKKEHGQSRGSRVRFCRVIEDGQNPTGDEQHAKGFHIHAVLFFNGHQFNTLGDFNSGLVNLGFRIESAWASALAVDVAMIKYLGLVDFSGGGYLIDSNASDRGNKRQEMFYHYSYICKAYSKRFDVPVKAFSRSRG